MYNKENYRNEVIRPTADSVGSILGGLTGYAITNRLSEAVLRNVPGATSNKPFSVLGTLITDGLGAYGGVKLGSALSTNFVNNYMKYKDNRELAEETFGKGNVKDVMKTIPKTPVKYDKSVPITAGLVGTVGGGVLGALAANSLPTDSSARYIPSILGAVAGGIGSYMYMDKKRQDNAILEKALLLSDRMKKNSAIFNNPFKSDESMTDRMMAAGLGGTTYYGMKRSMKPLGEYATALDSGAGKDMTVGAYKRARQLTKNMGINPRTVKYLRGSKRFSTGPSVAWGVNKLGKFKHLISGVGDAGPSLAHELGHVSNASQAIKRFGIKGASRLGKLRRAGLASAFITAPLILGANALPLEGKIRRNVTTGLAVGGTLAAIPQLREEVRASWKGIKGLKKTFGRLPKGTYRSLGSALGTYGLAAALPLAVGGIYNKFRKD